MPRRRERCLVVSVELVSGVLALRGVTPREKLVLLALAEDARRGSRHASPGMDDDCDGRPGLLTRTAMKGSTIYEVTKALLATDRPGGPLLRQVSRGHGTGRGAGGRRAVFELLLPEHAASGTPDPDPSDSASGPPDSDSSQPPAHPESASSPPRVSLRGAGPLPEVPPGTTSLSPREGSAPMHTTARETTSEGDSFGTRAVAALGRDDLSPAQLDQAYKYARDRIGDEDAADAVTELAMQRGIENYPRYVRGIPDDDLRALADQHRHNRARAATSSARRPVEATPNRCEHGHPNGLRRAADGSSPCPLCDRAAATDGASGRTRGLAAA
jgi:hypothetical protein